MAKIVYVNHTAEHIPGDIVDVADEEARKLVNAATARYATDDDAVPVEGTDGERPEGGSEGEQIDGQGLPPAKHASAAKKK